MISRTEPLLRRRWAAGIALLALSAGGSTQSAPQQVAIAHEGVERGDAIAADVALDRAEKAGAARQSIAVLRGETCLLEGDLDCAREWLAPGEFLESEALRGFQLLGRLERRAGDPAAAAQAYDRALVIDNRNADLWVDIAELRYTGSEESIAFDALAYALQLDPALPRAMALQARLIRQRDGLLPALPFFVQAIDAASSDTGLLLDYAAVLGETDQGEAFLAASRAAIAQGGKGRALYLQAVLVARAGDFETARSLMERVPSEGDSSGVTILRAMIEMEVGSIKSAQQMLERLHNRDRSDGVVSRLYARALGRGDRNEALISIFAPAAARTNADPYLMTSVARAYERIGRRADAAWLLDRAAQTQAPGFVGVEAFGSAVGAGAYRNAPSRFDNVRDYARGLIGEGQTGLAKSVTVRLAVDFPNARDVRVLAGDAALADGDMLVALGRYEGAAAIRFSDRLLLRIVGALEAVGRSEEARRVAQSYLAKRPGNALASRIVAVQAANAGDWQLASGLLGYLLRSSGSRDVLLLSLASQSAAHLGRTENAIDYAERAMELQPSNDLAAASLALAREKDGMKQANARRSAGIYPDGARFPRALNRLQGVAARAD